MVMIKPSLCFITDAVTTHHRCCDENIIENCFSPPPHSKFRAQLLHFWKRRKQIRRKLKANVKSRKMELFEASETWWLWKSARSKQDVAKVKGEDKQQTVLCWLWQWHWVDAERAERRMDLFQIFWQNMFTSSHNVRLVMLLIIAGLAGWMWGSQAVWRMPILLISWLLEGRGTSRPQQNTLQSKQ